MKNTFTSYACRLSAQLEKFDWSAVELLAMTLQKAWDGNNRVFLCGNGGSAGNAVHLANDFLYGVGAGVRPGLDVEALTANPAVLTCLANDVSYDDVFSVQLASKGEIGDVLIVLSGSGNSENVVRALRAAKKKEIRTFAILGFDGGKCKSISDSALHFPINDMQIAEDLQLVVGHMCMQYLAGTMSNK